MPDARPLDQGKPRDEDTEGGDQPADKSLINRRLSLRSQLCAASDYSRRRRSRRTDSPVASKPLTANIRASGESPCAGGACRYCFGAPTSGGGVSERARALTPSSRIRSALSYQASAAAEFDASLKPFSKRAPSLRVEPNA